MGWEVSDQLLRVGRVKGEKAPLMAEYPVNSSTSPYLVTTTRSLLWVTEPTMNIGTLQLVRCASRIASLETLYREIILAIFDAGKHLEWGNIQPYTCEGLIKAIEYVRFYGFEKVEILCSRQTGDQCEFLRSSEILMGFPDVPLWTADWIPDGVFVVLPEDRSYIGSVDVFGS